MNRLPLFQGLTCHVASYSRCFMPIAQAYFADTKSTSCPDAKRRVLLDQITFGNKVIGNRPLHFPFGRIEPVVLGSHRAVIDGRLLSPLVAENT
jgi:hypothetical protein